MWLFIFLKTIKNEKLEKKLKMSIIHIVFCKLISKRVL